MVFRMPFANYFERDGLTDYQQGNQRKREKDMVLSVQRVKQITYICDKPSI